MTFRKYWGKNMKFPTIWFLGMIAGVLSVDIVTYGVIDMFSKIACAFLLLSIVIGNLILYKMWLKIKDHVK